MVGEVVGGKMHEQCFGHNIETSILHSCPKVSSHEDTTSCPLINANTDISIQFPCVKSTLLCNIPNVQLLFC